MMKKINLWSSLSVLFALGLFSASTAHAAYFSLLGGASSFNTDGGGKAQTSYVAGVGLTGVIASHTALEVDALYDNRSLGGSTAVKVLQVPAYLRFFLSPMIDIGVGGFFAKDMGDLKFLKDTDYGASGSLQIRFPLGSGSRFLIDARYLYGLSDLGGGAKVREINGLAGLQFPL